MLYRFPYVLNRKVLDDSGELTVDIKISDPITAMTVEFRGTNGSVSNLASLMCECVDAIEIIDGSDVLFSMDGHQAMAYTVYMMDRFPMHDFSECPNVNNDFIAYIPFGRFPGDPIYGFDPTKFVNPQVRVKWNLANKTTVGTEGFVSGTGRLTIIPQVMVGAPAPSRILMAKEIFSWTGTDGATEYVDLPRDYKYRALMLRASKADASVIDSIDNIKLNCDTDKFVPFDCRMEDMFKSLMTRFGPYQYQHMIYPNNGAELYCILKQHETVALCPYTPGDIMCSYDNNAYGQGTMQVYLAGVASETRKLIMVDTHGWLPWSCQLIPFGDLDDPGDWFPAPAYGSVRLEVEAGESSLACSLVAIQDRPY